MDKKREFKILKEFAKDFVSKITLKKINKIPDISWRLDALKYAISTSIEMKYYELEKILKEKKQKGYDVFVAYTYFKLLKSKIKLFNATFDRKDFNNLFVLFSKIKKELKDV